MGIQIRDLRKRRALSLEDLADMAGVPLEIVRDIEIGVLEVGSEHTKRIRRVLDSEGEPRSIGLSVRRHGLRLIQREPSWSGEK